MRGNGSVWRVTAEVTEVTDRVGLTCRVLVVTDVLVRLGVADSLRGNAEDASGRSGEAERGLDVKRLAIPGLVRNGREASAFDAKSASSSGLLGRVVRRGNTLFDVDATGGGMGRIDWAL